jgi:hypothetical protein
MKARQLGLRYVISGMLIAIFAVPASAADPLTLILLRLLRDQIISSVASRAVEGAIDDQKQRALLAPIQPSKPGRAYGMDDSQLRRLIDEGFVHLTAPQRDEVFASVKRIIDDPKNEAQVPFIISEIAIKASAVRQAHEQLNRLSAADKRLIAAQAREEFEKMKPEERDEMQRVLRLRMAPLPEDLNEMILSEFARPLPDEQPAAQPTEQSTGKPAPQPATAPSEQAPAPQSEAQLAAPAPEPR